MQNAPENTNIPWWLHFKLSRAMRHTVRSECFDISSLPKKNSGYSSVAKWPLLTCRISPHRQPVSETSCKPVIGQSKLIASGTTQVLAKILGETLVKRAFDHGAKREKRNLRRTGFTTEHPYAAKQCRHVGPRENHYETGAPKTGTMGAPNKAKLIKLERDSTHRGTTMDAWIHPDSEGIQPGRQLPTHSASDSFDLTDVPYLVSNGPAIRHFGVTNYSRHTAI